MPRYKDSPEVRAAKQERREKLRELLALMEVEDVRDLKSVFKEMVGEVLENGLEAELDDKLGYTKYDYRNKDTDNSRNGHSVKTVKTSAGEVEIAVPRDRKAEFKPQIIRKNETSLSWDIEEKIISMYAKGMTTNDISAHIEDIYGIEVSDSLVSRITDKILPVVKEWQQRPLESIYAVVFMDAIHYNVRCEGRIVKKAVYIAIGRDDEYYGSGKSQSAYNTLYNLYKQQGLTESEIDKILVIDIKEREYFTSRNVDSEHGGGGLFAEDKDIMSWLFGKH